MGTILHFDDSLENKLRRGLSNLNQCAVDLAGYNAYVFQREIVDLEPDSLYKIGFMGWSPEQIERIEAIYQGEKK